MSHDNEGIIDVDENGFKEVLSKSKMVLVDFWAPWCMPCQMQGRLIQDSIKDMPDGAVVAKVNVDDNPSIARKYGVKGIPQMFLFVDGKPEKGWTGVTPADVLYTEMKRFI